MSLMGDKVSKIFLRFLYVVLSVVTKYQIICVNQFDFFFHKLIYILWGL